MPVADPTLDLERELLRAGSALVIGCDEVGRGALAGPVAVGMAAVGYDAGAFPVGLRDSKMLSEKRREALHPLVSAWVRHSAVGMASAEEVDSLGITACLGLAGRRALVELHHLGVPLLDSVVLLDGSHDWLTPALAHPVPVRLRVKADRDCASVSAASVLAKVHRDRLMAAWHDESPEYGWAGNKGYGSPAHLDAIRASGASPIHRRTWLTGVLAAPGV
ncbi:MULTISPECIES: ribonuclease HII [Clavibacter]|uniref:Ribonuclease n=1 Tax=Clavibacter tessellarius TaxID=31965 RepID=A0A154UXN8_9MICO|nr:MULTISPECIES: ribonuclease HII [Clavibacter]KZC93851.1 ribonuclease HII [Clavibacter michiganensis subsp. tessellarius]MDA3804437.1 ribonuclease HII [Clavibacter sp. CT19]